MSSIHTIRVTKFEIGHSRRWFQMARTMASAAFLLVLAGCSSAITKLETWEGSPATAVNAATLKAPGAIHVSQVNGRSMTNYLMDDLALDYALLPGDNQVVFTYKTIWAKSGVVDNGESKVYVIESEPQVVRFDANPNETYHFEFDKPDSRQSAEKMMPEFSAAVVGENGQALAQSSNWSPDDSALLARTPANDGAVSGYNTDSLKQLKAVWGTATDEERKAFLRWAFE
ncbi:DUF2057 family protein [Marinobacter sp.]|uniref:DUF2057 family protein n=1 Tax=Marinobacter sp. TaxID=50741 RepID=UPI0025C0A37F|nr:DUF2057 family protein [Marinobacter sp.]